MSVSSNTPSVFSPRANNLGFNANVLTSGEVQRLNFNNPILNYR